MDDQVELAMERIRMGAETRRYHGQPVLREQSVGLHSFHVAMICYMLVGRDFPGVRVPLLMAALTHDLAEGGPDGVGDMPAPAKRLMPDYHEGVTFKAVFSNIEEKLLEVSGLNFESMLNDDEQRILKLADNVEGALYCARERMLGNKFIEFTYHKYCDYVREVADTTRQVERDMLSYIDKQWEKAVG